MGFMDKFTKMLGGNKEPVVDTVKPPSSVLRENGIDPSNLKFKFNQDGSVGVSGTATSQQECDRICELVEGIPSVSGVQNNITVAAPEPAPIAEVAVEAEEVVVAEVAEAEAAVEGRTYTVQSGDTLWKISEAMYGSGGKYMKIFEANTDLLENPDKIRPGQKLVIPDID